METINLLSALLLGLMGAGHCIAMCGGIISSLTVSTADSKVTKNWWFVVMYQIGRISSYTALGGLAGWLGMQFNQISPLPILKFVSGILLLAMAFYISQIWMGLSYLEKLGKYLWKILSPLSKFLLPVKSTKQALMLGALWGWLPCGLVYTSLGYAVSLGDTIFSALFMLVFGLGTLPATLLAGSASLGLKKALNYKSSRYISAIIFLLLGLYTLYSIFGISMGEQHHHH